MGAQRKTTKTTETKALDFAAAKVRDLDAGETRQWVDRGEAEALSALREIAGTSEGAMRRLVEDVRGAVKWLDDGSSARAEMRRADLTVAARWYAENGPLKVERTTLASAVARFLAEYDGGSKETRRTFGHELESFLQTPGHAEMMLMDLDEPRLARWTSRKVRGGKAAPADRTRDNRITTWITCLNRWRDWRLLWHRCLLWVW